MQTSQTRSQSYTDISPMVSFLSQELSDVHCWSETNTCNFPESIHYLTNYVSYLSSKRTLQNTQNVPLIIRDLV